MDRKIMKQILVVSMFAASWLGGWTTAEGCWLRRMFEGTSQTTYMLPVAAAPAPAATPYTTNYPPAWQPTLYAPQAQYQTMWRPYPITTYNPVAANGLVPTVGYGVQANRVPVMAYQPVLTAPPATPMAPTALPPASVAPTLTPGCNCTGASNTAYYGSTSAWTDFRSSSLAPTTAAYAPTTTYAPTTAAYAPTTTYAPTTAAYAPSTTAYAASTTVNYGTASDWTPVTTSETTSYASHDAAAPSAPSSTTLKPWQVPSEDNSAQGATPWMTEEEFRRRQDHAAVRENGRASDAADEAPQLLPRAGTTSVPELDNDRDAAWRTYDDESNQPVDNGVSSSSTRANVRYVPPKQKQQLVPFNRPIPDPAREGNGWDFDDKLQLQNRESRSARATTRWRAIPVHSVSSPSQPASSLDRLLEPPPRSNVRQEGGWQSVPR